MSELPSDTTLNIAPLARAFDHVATSYKFLWILGILDVLEEKEQKEQTPNADNVRIQTRDIVERMLMAADAPLNRYRLFFGAEDRMKEHIEKWRKAQKEDDNALKGLSGGHKAEKALMKIRRELTRFVPMQFMTPFFEGKVKLPSRSGARATKICQLATDCFFDTATQPLYRMELKPGPSYIEMHPGWRKYLLRHREIIRGWVHFNWIDYLQARNPYSPSIISKIAHPDRREDVQNEREWWGKIIQQCDGVKCIYSGTKILPGDTFQLDHYVPWSYVAHNRLWNLVPVMGVANASKNDRLPKQKKYFSKFVQMQHDALQASREICGDYKNITSAYTDDLKIEVQSPPEMDKLRAAYSIVIPPLIDLARAQGFSEWEYDVSSPK